MSDVPVADLFLATLLEHIKLEEGRIEEVKGCKDEAEDEREMYRLRHVGLARLAGAGLVLLERHHRVEREQEGVEEKAVDIVDSLVENDSPEE